MNRFLITVGLFPLFLLGQTEKNPCKTLSRINTLIQENHYKPKPVDDSLSVYVFDTFMDQLDANRNLFTQIEYQKLAQHRLQLDNYIVQKNCSFMNDFVSAYQLALKRKKKILDKIQKEAFDYNTNDTVKFSKKNFPFDLAEKDLERVWKKRLRYDILEEISKLSTNLDSLNIHFEKLEKNTKTKVFDFTLYFYF